MLNFWTRRIQNPIELQLDVLNQMASDFDVPYVSRVVLRTNVIMLHYSRGVEIGNERRAGPVGCVGRVAHRVVQNVV